MRLLEVENVGESQKILRRIETTSPEDKVECFCHAFALIYKKWAKLKNLLKPRKRRIFAQCFNILLDGDGFRHIIWLSFRVFTFKCLEDNAKTIVECSLLIFRLIG